VNAPIDFRRILGLDIAILTRDAAVRTLEQRICQRNPVRLAFVNANLANMAYKDALLRQSLQNFLLVNDGVGLEIASRILYGKGFPDNLNGTDFIPYFLGKCRAPLNVFMLGARPAVILRAANAFLQRWPDHKLVGFHHGFFAGDEDRVLELVKQARPDLVLVAMGNGLQECIVARLVPDVAQSAWAVGALFDFIAGDVRRAPLWMRKNGLEWGYRFWQEPLRLWRRYLAGNPAFIIRVLRKRASRKEN